MSGSGLYEGLVLCPRRIASIPHRADALQKGSNTVSYSSPSVRSWATCTSSTGYVPPSPPRVPTHLVFQACVGAGTHEDLLNEILLGRSNQEMYLLKEGYQRTYGKDLVGVVRGELSMKTERYVPMLFLVLFVCLS